MPQLRPRCARAQKAKPIPITINPTPSHCPTAPGWYNSTPLIDVARPTPARRPACRPNDTTTSTMTMMSRRSPQARLRHGTLLLAFLLNCARTSQPRMNAAQRQAMTRGTFGMPEASLSL